MRKKKPGDRAKYLPARTRYRLLEHVAAFAAIRKEVSYHEQEVLRVAYKPRVTCRDLGKIYSALNCLRGVSSKPEAAAAVGTLQSLGLEVDK